MSQYFSFQWRITDECDQRCKHCYIFSGEDCKELNGIAEIEKDTFYLNGQSISFERRNLQNVKGLWL